jgi:hypothetical protein
MGKLIPFFVALFPQKHGIFMEFLILIFGKSSNYGKLLFKVIDLNGIL